jgi:N6-L-threonylcarbamoyladenine synthase
MIDSPNLDMSFSGLKTAVLTAVQRMDPASESARADIARAFVDAVVDVLTAKAVQALARTELTQLVVAGGVGANIQLRAGLDQAITARGGRVYYPPPQLCTDNGAMIAYAGYVRLAREGAGAARSGAHPLRVHPRWDLCNLGAD